MRVLVACEFSGIVRSAFRERGHEAWSCDLLPAEDGSPYHYQQDFMSGVLDQGWDLLIAHPPCTYLTNAGVRWLYQGGKGTVPNPVRWEQMKAGCRAFTDLWLAPIPRICIENPIMHRHAKQRLMGAAPTQIIQPWQFGHGETKATCLWLKNLPPLQPTKIVEGREPRVHYASPGPERWKERSRTLKGIAEAMAEQWGGAW